MSDVLPLSRTHIHFCIAFSSFSSDLPPKLFLAHLPWIIATFILLPRICKFNFLVVLWMYLCLNFYYSFKFIIFFLLFGSFWKYFVGYDFLIKGSLSGSYFYVFSHLRGDISSSRSWQTTPTSWTSTKMKRSLRNPKDASSLTHALVWCR